jgi:hypothetical protein
MLIRSKNDRVLVEISGSQTEEKPVQFFFKPLTVGEKTEITGRLKSGSDMGEMLEFTRLVISKTLKDVKGLERADGSSYRLEFEGDSISHDCLDDLMNLEINEKFITVAGMFLKGVPSEGAIVNPQTGKALEGVVVKKNSVA